MQKNVEGAFGKINEKTKQLGKKMKGAFGNLKDPFKKKSKEEKHCADGATCCVKKVIGNALPNDKKKCQSATNDDACRNTKIGLFNSCILRTELVGNQGDGANADNAGNQGDGANADKTDKTGDGANQEESESKVEETKEGAGEDSEGKDEEAESKTVEEANADKTGAKADNQGESENKDKAKENNPKPVEKARNNPTANIISEFLKNNITDNGKKRSGKKIRNSRKPRRWS